LLLQKRKRMFVKERRYVESGSRSKDKIGARTKSRWKRKRKIRGKIQT